MSLLRKLILITLAKGVVLLIVLPRIRLHTPSGPSPSGPNIRTIRTNRVDINALKILKAEAPSDDDEKALYDAVFQRGDNATPEGDSAVNILKGRHIKQLK